MEVKATVKYIKISPRKVRLVVDVIRGLKVDKALDQLNFLNKKAVRPIEKLINSAVANAENNFELEKDNLFIKEIKVNEGPTLHRWKPRARGRATPIRKRTSHICLALGELVESGEIKAKKQKLEAPVKLGVKPKEDEGVKIKDKKTAPAKGADDKHEEETGKKIIDPRGEGKGKYTKIEGGAKKKGFGSKFFRRKSG
ncbi:50S ribosomal protein L22 [Candidatus Falkowbacteria bacterium]|nr:MAG: 50S ribosomal protein L22 [Candidatus Falkowbacteria bacterium]